MGTMKRLVDKERLLVIVGMTFFWALFRHQTVMQRVFPVEGTISFGGIVASKFAVFLTALFVLGALAFLFARNVENFLVEHRMSVLVCSALGTLGIVMGTAGEFSSASAFWVCTALFAVGFLALYLSWASWCSHHYSLETIFVLSISYLLSLFLFTAAKSLFPALLVFLVELLPLACGLCFYLLPQADGGLEERSAKDIPRYKLLYIALFITFLLVGSITRGIVDSMNGFSSTSMPYSMRRAISLLMALAICLMCVHRYLKFVKRAGGADALKSIGVQKGEYVEGERLTLLCWIFFVLLFFVGMAVIVASQSYALGGHIVVVARSGLDFLLWILLCGIAASERVRTCRLFLVCGVLTEIASWTISYLIIPLAATESQEFFSSLGGRSILLSLFFLLAMLTLTFGALSLNREPVDTSGTVADMKADRPDAIAPELVGRYGLSKREAEVAWLYGQGYSLSKVASRLFISTGTAQTHIKSIYRKLDIHSRNELIEIILPR